ncbi:HypC/HybG/HupF family hydrogenase formation chaperone [Ferrimonas senticii]|uniref:HypC/HybG/HupF family hydrogenase formation chaperone n=1 Tax=Ferrimonas senticii TaxID=394566 RepID=UPI00041C6B19|nr:HypC/HybG/HupF family hydrogenase formation chaperone [Ferrimonas senticii]
MCLSIPSEVVELHPDDRVTVDTLGVKRQVSSQLIAEPLAIGDYVLLHVGFAMNKIDKATALETLTLLKQLESANE